MAKLFCCRIVKPLLKLSMARTLDCRIKVLKFESYITGHHVYQYAWEPYLGEELQCRIEHENEYDKYAVAIIKNERIVGHIPASLARYCNAALRAGAVITGQVNGHRCNTRQNGIEVPCQYSIRGRSHLLPVIFRCI